MGKVALQKLFDEMDADGGGSINKKEFKSFCDLNIHMNLDKDQVALLLRLLDEDGGGEIEFPELAKVYFGDKWFKANYGSDSESGAESGAEEEHGAVSMHH